MDENLKKLEEFFKRDRIIKDILVDAKNIGLNDYESYFEKLDKIMESLEIEFFKIMKWDELDSIIDAAVTQKVIDIKSNVQKEGDTSVINSKYLSGMDEQLVEDVKNNFRGYTFFDPIPFINRCNSINELLHVVHSYIVNNDELLQKMPIIAQKNLKGFEDDGFNKIVLYGNEKKLNEYAKNLFEDFPIDISGPTDIISLENRTLIMVRDRGHAISIEVDATEKEQNPIVRYYIPKVCNKDKVNQLRGVNLVYSDDALATTKGRFVLTEAGSTKELIDFIKTVPTDNDIVFESFPREPIDFEQPQKEEARKFTIEDADTLAQTRRLHGIYKSLQRFKVKIQSDKDAGMKGNDNDGRY